MLNDQPTGRVPRRRDAAGFTLVEVMIVVVIMAILAGIAIPGMTNTTNETRTNTALYNLATLRSMVQNYRAQHGGALPSQTLIELTSQSNALGVVGSGANFPYGPYVQAIPVNPFNESSLVTSAGSNPPTTTVSGAGWLYDAPSGNLWINDTTVPFASQ
jgi:type II secretion system protein G